MEYLSEDALKERLQDAEKLVEQGDKSFDEKDFLTAQMYYMRALDAFYDLKEDDRVQSVQQKYDLSRSKHLETQGKKIQAEDTEFAAREFYENRNFVEAKESATQAKNLYLEMGMQNKADEMDILLQQIATDAAIAEALK